MPVIGLVVCAILWPAMLTFDVGDWPSRDQYPHHPVSLNACGPVGAWCAWHLRYYLGDGTYPLILFLTLAAFMRLVRGEIGNLWERAFGLALIVGSTSAATQLVSAPGASALHVGNGGLFGFILGELLAKNLSGLGTVIVLGACMFVGLMFATEGWVLTLPSLIKRAGQASGEAVAAARQFVSSAGRSIPAAEGINGPEREMLLDAGRAAPGRRFVSKNVDREASEIEEEKEVRKGAAPVDGTVDGRIPRRNDRVDDVETVAPGEPRAATAVRSNWKAATDDASGKKLSPAPASPAEKPESKIIARAPGAEEKTTALRGSGMESASISTSSRPAPIVRFPSARQAALAEPYPRKIENWSLPPLALLREPEYGFSAQQESIVREQAKVLERTLEEFRLDARVVEIDTGPVITMFELKLGAGIKVSQIAVLSNDIARALKAHAIRVVAPISGKNTVGIEVPNSTKERVRMKELLQLTGKKAAEMHLPLFLGKDAGGAALMADLTKMPHLLIAGTTGSGKSVCLNAVILSFLMTQRPDHVKLILIDPKMVEMSQFKEIPHLMCPIVTDIAQAEKILEWSVTKMDERYELLAEARVKNIDGYNELGAEELYARLKPDSAEEKNLIPVRLPYIVIVIDELADLMMTAAREVEHHLSRLAQKSRAVGIHIIVATQRPEVRVVTGLIKSNLPSRICFRVASRMDSRIVLDQNGGEVLLGQGDMLFLPPGSHKLTRAQGTYLEDEEVQAVLDDLASRAKPQFHPELIRLPTGGLDVDGDGKDPLFDEAVRIVLESRRGSVSLLQRRLTIGYSRASRLIDQMSAASIVGEYKGSQAREVTMTLDEWESLRARVEADKASGYEADRDDGASPNSAEQPF